MGVNLAVDAGPSRIGRPRKWPMRAIMNALLYIASTGCQRRFLPKDFPPFLTVQKYFYRWRDEGLLEIINHRLVAAAREKAGREAQPTAGVIDSQSVKTAESGGVSGYDGGKKIKGRKRHILTDTLGFIVAAIIHAADIQDRDCAPAVLAEVRGRFPWMRHVFADGGYAGRKLRQALSKIGDWTIDIIKRSDSAKGFIVLPRRWVVERTFAWLGRSRRLVKDWERTIESSLAWLFIAHTSEKVRKKRTPDPKRRCKCLWGGGCRHGHTVYCDCYRYFHGTATLKASDLTPFEGVKSLKNLWKKENDINSALERMLY